MTQSKKREASFKSEQEREYEAMVSKTAHLRELRLAKEVADQEFSSFDSRFASEGTASNQEVREQNFPR